MKMAKSALDNAIEDLSEMVTILEEPAPSGWVMICSGGPAVDPDAPPVLCLSRDLAVKHWMVSMTEWIWRRKAELDIVNGACIRWAEDPAIYRYSITMQQDLGHRIAEERFAVICRVWIGSLADGEKLPAERPAKPKETER